MQRERERERDQMGWVMDGLKLWKSKRDMHVTSVKKNFFKKNIISGTLKMGTCTERIRQKYIIIISILSLLSVSAGDQDHAEEN